MQRLRKRSKIDPNGRPSKPWGSHWPASRVLDYYEQREFLCDPRQLEPVLYDESIWKRLVLPPEDREILLDSLYREGEGQDQVYNKWGLSQKHKGNGLIVLCQGPPGTGKTMTAEAISGLLRRPLLTLQSWAARDEKFVERLFSEAARWKLVVLVDEAESFLGHRQEGALGQNGLIATMLRQIERFSGVMILTTNRDFEIDPAAKSRVHVTLKYKRPNAILRSQIWERAIPKAMIDSSFLKEDLTKLSMFDLDGRQIDHAVARAASRAARQGREQVTLTDLEAAAQATLSKNESISAGFRA
jgi:SpoVK/Ycf46/Vps4 family AAA+-type ATPase